MPTRDQLRAFPWDCLTHLIVNEGELADIATAFDAAPTAGSVADTARVQMSALSQAQGFNSKIVIVTTIGPEGVVVLDPRKGQESMSWPAAKVSKVVDTTGAGDTFAGYFVSLLMELGDDAPLDSIIPICLTVSFEIHLVKLTPGVCPHCRDGRCHGEHCRARGCQRAYGVIGGRWTLMYLDLSWQRCCVADHDGKVC